MTVAELIAELETIEDKTLDVVADTGLTCFGDLYPELVCDVMELDKYYGKYENGGYVVKTRRCVEIL